MQTDELAAQEACPHIKQERIIDRLGLMTEKPDGTVSAPVLAWHVQCVGCLETLLVSEAVPYGGGEKITVDKVAWALGADEGGSQQPTRPGQRMTLASMIRSHWRHRNARR